MLIYQIMSMNTMEFTINYDVGLALYFVVPRPLPVDIPVPVFSYRMKRHKSSAKLFAWLLWLKWYKQIVRG